MRKYVVALLVLVLAALLIAPALAQEEASGVNCAGSLAPRLVIGQQGVIAERFSTLRSAPAGRPIRVMRSPATFTVIDGPQCAGFGPLTWYKLDYGNGDVGWAAESQKTSIYGNNRYWLAPAPAAG
jgi:hypothetical protein